MLIRDIDKDNFYILVPKDAFDFSISFSGMLFFKRQLFLSKQRQSFDNIDKRYCYLPNRYTGEKEIINLEKTEEKYNKLYIKVLR